MKKALFFALAFVASSLHAQTEVTLNFNLKNVHANDTLTLSWGANNKAVTPLITSFTPYSNDVLSLPLNEPRVVVLSAKGHNDKLELLLAPGEKVTVSGRISNNKNAFKKLRVTGAQYQDDYQNTISQFSETCDSIDEAVKSDFKDCLRIITTSKQTGNEQAIADMYQTERGKQYIDRIMSTFEERSQMLENIIDSHKQNFMGPLLMIRLIGRLSKNDREMYNRLSDEAKLSYYGREAKDEVYPPSLTGDIAPTVTVQNAEGQDKVLSFTRHGNRYLLLDFWASWCEPCHKEIPNLMSLYEKYHSKGLDIIGISADRNADDWKASLEELKEPWCNYIDVNRQAIQEYKVQYIPSIFILNTEGHIIAEKLRGKELKDFIDNLFKE